MPYARDLHACQRSLKKKEIARNIPLGLILSLAQGIRDKMWLFFFSALRGQLIFRIGSS